jgi:ribosomal protein S19
MKKLNEEQQQFIFVDREELNNLRQKLKELEESIKEVKKQYASSKILTREETSKYFKVSIKTIDLWARDKIIIPHKVGNKVYYRFDELQATFSRKEINKSFTE